MAQTGSWSIPGPASLCRSLPRAYLTPLPTPMPSPQEPQTGHHDPKREWARETSHMWLLEQRKKSVRPMAGFSCWT